MTPQERRKYLDAYSKVVQAKNAQNKARAQALHAAKEQTEIERINEERLKAWEEYQRQAASQAQAQKAQEENNKGGFFGGLGYVGEKFSLGIMRGLEGISDFLVGGTADLLGFDEFADERMKTDWFNYNHADEWYKPSGTMSFIGDVAGGVGGMLPAIGIGVGVSLASGGAAAPAALNLAGQIASTSAFGVGAAGQAVSEQTKKNGSADGKEWLYGIGSGVMETGIEMASGGIGGSQMGKVMGKQLGKTTAGKIATTFVSEGLEEVASDILDPALQRVTGVDKTATVDWSGLPRTFAVGGATGAVMGGGSRALNAARAGGFTNLNVAESAQELQNELAENNVRQAQGKKSTYTQKDLAFHRDRLSKNLQKLTPEARQAFLSQNKNIAPFFNEDGTVRQFTAQDNVAQNSPDSAAENKNLAAVGARKSIRNKIVMDNNGNQYVQADRQVIKGNNPEVWKVQIIDYINDVIRQGKDLQIKTIEGDTVTITENTAGKAAFQNKGLNKEGFKKKLNAEAHIDELSEISIAQKNADGTKKIKPDYNKKHQKYDLAKDGWSYRTAYFSDFNGDTYKVRLSVAKDGTVESIYNVGEMKKASTNGESRLIAPQRAVDASTNSIRSKIENVNSFSKKSSEKNSQTFGNINEEAYSRSLQGRETELAYAPVSAEAMPTETAKRVMKNVTLLSNGKANVVLTAADMRAADGQVAAGQFINGVLYLNANATEYEHAMLVGAHELVHSLEGTKEYAELSKYIGELMKADPKLQERYNYEKYRAAYDNSQSFELSEETKEYQALTEICADFVAGEILNTESAIYRLTSQHRNVAVRMLDWVKGALKRLSMGKAERETYRAMKTVEKLLTAALEASTGGLTLEEVEAGVQTRASAEMQETDTSAETEQKETTDNSSVDNSATKSLRYSIKEKVFKIGKDSELAERIRNSSKSKYTVIKDYLVEKFGNTVFTLSDGKKAIMDNSDAEKLKYKANTVRIAELSNLKELVEQAELLLDDTPVDHPKFDKVSYYKIKVDFEGNSFDIIINVGRAKNDHSYHIYVITNYNEERFAGRDRGLSSPVGNWKINESSTTIIRENSEKSTQNAKKVEKSSTETEQKETTDNSSVDNSAPKSARYQIKQFNKDKYDFDESIKSVAGMKAVAELTGNEFVIGTPGLYNQIADYFDSLNNNAFNPDLGDVELKRRGVKDSVAHGLGKLKTVAFKAVPNIIQKGKVVDYQTNWKGNAYDTAVIAAPITIANHEYYAAVVVRRTDTKQRFYLHEIDIKKRQAVQTEAATENSSKELGGSPINSIFEKIRKVNTFDENSSKNTPARHFLDVNARKTDPKEAMRQYLHRIDLTQETKDALHEKYGEETARRIINIWDNTSGKAGVDMSTVTRELADKGAYIDAYYPEDVLYEMDREMRGDTITDYDFNKQIRRVTETREKQSLGQKAQAVKLGSKEEWVDLQIQATNVQAGIEAAARRLGVQGMEAKTHKARCASAAALNMITNGQWNAAMTKQVGKSLDDIFAPIMEKGDAYYQEFCEFVLHWHNEDRMRLEERAQREMRSLELNDYALRKILERKDISEGERNRLLDTVENGKRYKELKAVKNKPVFSEKITAKESVARRAELLRKHPEFLEAAKELWGYFDNLLQYRVDHGLITQELADGLRKKYPHYVPTVRDTDNVALGSQKKRTHEVKKTIKNATGGDSEILDISLMAINQTKAVVKAAAENDILNALYEAAERAQDFTDIELLEKEKVEDAEIDYEADKPKENRAVFYRNGEKVTVLVSKQVFVGLEAYRTNTRAETRAEALLVKMNSITKALVTQWNPLFLVRNAVRDFQEAMFYTKNGMGKFIMNLPRAVAMMKRKDKLWQIYLAMGGTASGYYNNETGIYDRRGKVRKGFGKLLGLLETANSVVEQLPRFNEFVLSVKNGASYEQALLDSADVTTNFSRGGKLTKRLNRAVIPFLNPSVQGWSKLWRTATGRKTARKWTAFVLKCMAVGLSVGLVNDLINGDDEEYQKLRQSDKDNYYLLPVGEKFIKIPKGRVVAFFGSFADRSKQLINGEEGAFDDWMSSAAQMVSPIQNIGRSFFAPFKDVATNTTWYGGEIEGQALQSYVPSERYDESTSSIAVWLGKTFDYSPKKIHYLIDQYSGVIGDIILPATTAKAEQDMLSSAFVIDPVLSNEISTEFYDLLDETTYAKNAGNVTAVLELRYLNSVSSAVSDMYKQKREIANDTTLSDKEKQTQTRVVQELINQTLAAAISGVEDFEQLLIDMDYEAAATALAQNKLYADFSEKQRTSAAKKLTDYYYAKAYSKLSGERYSYKYYLYDCVGGEKAATYLTAIAAIEGEKDSKGKTVANSRKKKIVAYIEDLRLSALQKYVLLLLAGYTPSDTGQGLIMKYLTEQGFTKAEIEEIL